MASPSAAKAAPLHSMRPHSPSHGIIGRWTFADIAARIGLDSLQKLPVADQVVIEAEKAKGHLRLCSY